MRVWVVSVSMLALAASCRRADEADVDCPPEATVERVQLGSGDEIVMQRTCSWADRQTVIETDARGAVVGRMSFRDGELDGLQIMRDQSRDRRSELTFRLGVLHGPRRDFVGEELASECFYIDGVRDGVCWSSPVLTPMEISTVQQYDRGKRTGVWSYVSEGKVLRSWVYGDDILLGIDGRSVSPPPASIEVDGEVIWRTSCGPVMSHKDACPALFEAYQFCEGDAADRTNCRENARKTYRHMKDRQPAKDRFRRSDGPVVE